MVREYIRKKEQTQRTSTSTGNKRENTHYSFTIRCTTAPSAHASYKGYGCNNPKTLRPPHRNTIIDVVVLGYGPIRTGEGAAAPFIGVHILGEIRLAGGFDTLAESWWEDRVGPYIPGQKSAIPQSTVGCLVGQRIGRGTEKAALFVATEIGGNIRRLRRVEGMASW